MENIESKGLDINNELMELQVMKQQLHEIEQYINEIDKRILEVQQSLYDLQNFRDRKENQEVLVPIVSGVFVKGQLKDIDKVLIGVGAGVVIESDLDHAIAILNRNLATLTKQREEFVKEGEVLVNKMRTIEEKINRVVALSNMSKNRK